MPVRTRTLSARPCPRPRRAAAARARPSASARSTFTVTLDDYLIRPQSICASPSGKLTVTVVNRGRAGPHAPDPRQDTATCCAFTTIQPGEPRRARSSCGQGTYTMYCVLANHEELGMHGTLMVG